MSRRALETALLRHASVRDCAVIERPRTDGGTSLVAYVVSDRGFFPDRLDRHVRRGAATPPDAYVQVAAIPLDRDGAPDRDALLRVPVVDGEVVERWRSHLAGLPRAEEVAVVEDEAVPGWSPSLHLASLVPGWTGGEERAPVEKRRAPDPGRGAGTRPAEASGGPFEAPSGTPETLGAALSAAAADRADTEICHLQGEDVSTETYRELRERAVRVGAGIRSAGVSPGAPVLIQLAATSDFVGAFWGCVAAGAVPVPVGAPPSPSEDAGAVERLVSAWKTLDRPLILSDRRGAGRWVDLARKKGLSDFRAVELAELEASGRVAGDSWHRAEPDDVALMMLTSGTTGVPKAVTLTHRNLIGRSAAERRMLDLGPDDVTLNWMPMDHVAGLVFFHIRDVYLGCRQLHGTTDQVLPRPTRWLDWIDRHRASVTFAPNFAYALINDRADEIAKGSWDLSTVRYFHNGGEAVVAATARRFLALLEPHGLSGDAMIPAWGMSETSSAATFGTTFSRESTSDDDPFVEVGAPVPGFRVRIVDGEGRTVRGETEGRLEVRGVPVTPGYHENPEANVEAFTADGWFRTGDLGILRDGRLTITGRVKDVIIVNGINYYGHEIEKVVDDVDGVSPTWSAACGVRAPGAETDRLAIFFHSEIEDDRGLARLLEEIRRAVGRRVGVRPRYLVPVATEEVPRTGIGKIQRPLLKARFEAGDFDERLRRVERLLGGPETVPPWFFRPTWVRRAPRAGDPARGDRLVLLDDSETGARLRSLLREDGARNVIVRSGTAFERHDGSEYRIDPAEPGHFRRVLEEVTADGVEIRSVLHLWPCSAHLGGAADGEGSAEVQRLGTHALLNLLRAVDEVRADDATIHLLAVTRGAFRVDGVGGEGFASAPVAAVTRTASQEIAWLEARTLDLAGGDPAGDAASVLEELHALPVDPEAARRGGRRWVRRLERLDEAAFGGSEPPVRPGGIYLVTGGLGGIGRKVARYLLEEFDARLLVVGRRELPGRGVGSADDPESRERLEALRELGELSGEIAYRAVDVADAAALAGAVEAAEEAWSGTLDGVFHLAGGFRERVLLEESVDAFAAAGRAKIAGTRNLHEIVRARPRASFVAFSSVNAFFGGYGAGAYAAANAFLEAATRELRRRHGVDARCLAWSLWDEVGMSRGYARKEAARARGFRLLSPDRGTSSLIGALFSGERDLVIGLDGQNPALRSVVVPARPERRRLVAYVAPRQAAPGDVGGPVVDRFGVPVSCEIRGVSRIPSGAGRRDGAGAGEEGEGGSGEAEAPTTDLERMLATEWKELLGLDVVGVRENLFDLGADSLLLAQAQARIRGRVDADVTLTTLYEFPTVRALADHLAGDTERASSAPGVAESERRGGERRARVKALRSRTAARQGPARPGDGGGGRDG